MTEKKLQCLTCRHNLKIRSCGPCANKRSMIIEDAKSAFVDEFQSSREKTDILKQTCKILMNTTENFDDIDPYKCKYYLSSALKFY